MARLPTVNGDNEAWGTVLNDFLSVGHNVDGSNKGGGGGTYTLASQANAGASTITLDRAPEFPALIGMVVLEPLTTGCEIRRVLSISGSTLTLDAALVNTHVAGETVFYTYDSTIHAGWFGVKADNSADDYAAIQAALDQAPFTMSGLTGNDKPSRVVQLPPGLMKTSAPLGMSANTVLRGHGPGSSYLKPTFTTATRGAVELKTGAEVECEIRDLGIIATNTIYGIKILFTGGASILGDSHHIVENVVIVGGQVGLWLSTGNTECRIVNVKCYRQRPAVADAAMMLNGTDHMIERCTVAQVQYDGSGQGGSAIRSAISNTRFVDCKIFGGNATTNGQQQPAFRIIGQRNQIIGLEVQDYAGGWAIQDDQGNNTYVGGMIDSCQGGGMLLAANIPVVVRGMMFVNRAGGSWTMPCALYNPAADSGADVDCKVLGSSLNVFYSAAQANYTGIRVRVNNEGGTSSVAYAATITPDPLIATTFYVGTLTGAITINNAASAFGNAIHSGMRLAFVLTQDGSGGRVVTFGAAYKTTAAIPTTASSVTRIEFEWDGTNWREAARATT